MGDVCPAAPGNIYIQYIYAAFFFIAAVQNILLVFITVVSLKPNPSRRSCRTRCGFAVMNCVRCTAPGAKDADKRESHGYWQTARAMPGCVFQINECGERDKP